MKFFLIVLFYFFLLSSCIPPGKLSESLNANTILSSKYDTLKNKLTDTVDNLTETLAVLNINVNNLMDSVIFYRAIASKPSVITERDVFFNQMLGLSLISKSELTGIKTNNVNKEGNNIWLEGFKADIKKYTSADADIRLNNGYVFVDISDKILFNSSSFSLTKKSKQVLATIASLLQSQPDLSFMIEGHTDNKAFKNNTKNDNWNLSVNRATAVARILQTKYKINPKRIIVAGRSEFIPLDNNQTISGRINNRRIRIIIMPSLIQLISLSK